MSRLFTDAANVLKEDVIVQQKKEIRHLRREKEQQKRLINELASNRYLRAVLSLIEEERADGYEAADVLDDQVERYMGGPVAWGDPAERRDIIPCLLQLGYRVLEFNDDGYCPFSVEWDTPLPDEAMLAHFQHNDWTYHMPATTNLAESPRGLDITRIVEGDKIDILLKNGKRFDNREFRLCACDILTVAVDAPEYHNEQYAMGSVSKLVWSQPPLPTAT